MLSKRAFLSGVAGLAFATGPALAQTYPDRPKLSGATI
jgi:hypothetical protein